MEKGSSEAKPGRVSRRAALTTMGAVSFGALGVVVAKNASASGRGPGSAHPAPSTTASASPSAPSCILATEEIDGPYYLDLEKVRSDISEGKPGTPLALRLTVVDATSCRPLPNAAVDIWHCDSGGLYSGYTSVDPNVPFGGGGTPPSGSPPASPPPSPSGTTPPTGTPPSLHVEPTDTLTFLRGVQVTDRAGVSQFHTIYPGWYAGRTVHVHVKVHVGGTVVHTGQLFFPDELTDQVYRSAPYAARAANRDTRNTDDRHYNNGGVNQTFALKRDGRGYLGSLTVGIKAA